MTAWRAFFLVAALYDLVLGLGFFVAYDPVFALLGIPLPNNTSYIHLTAAFVAVQGIGYWIVFTNPTANRGIVQLGVVYKMAFASLAFAYAAIGQLLHPIFLVFAVADLLFLAGFVAFLLGRAPQPEGA